MDRGTTEGALLIELGGRMVEYRFARRRRRTLGLTIDAAGLRVIAPLRAPWREIERFLRDKERWILRKLDEDQQTFAAHIDDARVFFAQTPESALQTFAHATCVRDEVAFE